MAPPLCCTHPTDPTRPLSPLDPPRPINHIFALAALPEDHPHANALRLPARRAPKLSKSIVRSPSFAGKIRGQLRRRRTVADFGAEVEVGGSFFDGDAKVLGSGKVLAAVGLEATPSNSGSVLSRLGVPPLAGSARRVRSSFALGVGWDRSERETSEVSDVELQDLALLNLDLAASQVDGGGEQLDGTTPPDEEVEADDQPIDGSSVETLKQAEGGSVQVSHGVEGARTENESVLVDDASPQDPGSVHDDDNNRSESHISFHLSKKHISQQLRSMSQLSGAPTDDTGRLTPEAWTFHRRERSNCGYGASTTNADSSRSRHMHQTSDSGINSTHVPTSWGRVVRDRDAASSIYSRPTSPEMPLPYDIPADLAAVADWPLTGGMGDFPGTSVVDGAETATRCSADQTETRITIVEPEQDPVLDISATTHNTDPETEACFVISHLDPSRKSSSSFTDKRSKFLERFTPPKKLVRKRRSFFKFLRAGSRRLQHRSISTPVLLSAASEPLVDGPADENELLTVQYELTGLEGNPVRSVSLNNLPSAATSANETQDVTSSPDLRRKPSLADYERHLSVVGDNRRRPSARDLKRLSQIEEDDLHEPVTTKKSFSLHSKTRETDPLMAAALERQLREKALFRSPSKRSVPVSEGSSMSFLMTPWNEPSSAQPQSPERDPLDTSFKSSSDTHLSPPLTPLGNYTPTASPSQQQQKGSKKPVVLHTPSSMSRDSTRSRIGSSLESWTRYPSHTRGERCASASAADNVLAHDFAIDGAHKRLGSANETDSFDPDRRTLNKQSTKSSKISLPKSHSATFTSFVRYYSNLFSSPDFHGKGRRTSIAMAGNLARPELEILPPVLPTSATSPSSTHSHLDAKIRQSPLAHINEQMEDNGETARQTSSVNNNHLLPIDVLAGSMIAFRGDSVFTSTAEDKQPRTEYADALNDNSQLDEADRPATSTGTSASTPPVRQARITDLDGTSDPTSTEATSPSSPTSKAQAWSTAYQSCLIIPPTPPSQRPDSLAMPPPALKPQKKRSPQQLEKQTARLYADAAIRRFPSVTVVDDRKGHWRSVSFISVKSDKSGASDGGFVRESSNDLLALVEKREREEREKLLRTVG